MGEKEAEPGGTEVEDKEEKGRRAGIRREGRGNKDRRGEERISATHGHPFLSEKGYHFRSPVLWFQTLRQGPLFCSHRTP